jgi:hypothetical protein
LIKAKLTAIRLFRIVRKEITIPIIVIVKEDACPSTTTTEVICTASQVLKVSSSRSVIHARKEALEGREKGRKRRMSCF